jgi:hypothetical protein
MICISDFGSGQERGKRHAPNYSDSHSDTVVDRRSTDVAVFKWLGLLSWRRDRSHSGYRPYIGLGGTNIAAITDQIRARKSAPGLRVVLERLPPLLRRGNVPQLRKHVEIKLSPNARS